LFLKPILFAYYIYKV